MVTAPAFLVSRVMHKRLRPRSHLFTYGVFYLYFPLSQTAQLRHPFLSVDHWNLLSFYNRDHGARNGSSLETWIRGILADHALAEADGEIVLVTMPRVLGYVFNPVSFWLCMDQVGQLRAVLSEVRNTFGEHHSYLSCHADHRPIQADDWLQSLKLFHVSPFLDVAGTYRFRFAVAQEKIAIHINLFDDNGLLLATSVTGHTQPITRARTVGMILNYPLMTIKIIALIHFEALRLWIKGMRYHSKPLPPSQEITR
jgi:DUF1365 family protein